MGWTQPVFNGCGHQTLAMPNLQIERIRARRIPLRIPACSLTFHGLNNKDRILPFMAFYQPAAPRHPSAGRPGVELIFF